MEPSIANPVPRVSPETRGSHAPVGASRPARFPRGGGSLTPRRRGGARTAPSASGTKRRAPPPPRAPRLCEGRRVPLSEHAFERGGSATRHQLHGARRCASSDRHWHASQLLPARRTSAWLRQTLFQVHSRLRLAAWTAPAATPRGRGPRWGAVRRVNAPSPHMGERSGKTKALRFSGPEQPAIKQQLV